MGRQEETLVAKIRSLFDSDGMTVPIGDDAAVVPFRGNLVVTTDMLIEDVDFTREIPLGFVARKSLAANLSDLAAMGAVPIYFTLSLGIPRDLVTAIDSFVDSLARAAREYRVRLVGGDLSAAEKLTVSITAFGSCDTPLLRSAARKGDRLYISRPLGGSSAGLALLQKGWRVRHDGEVEPPAGSAFGYAQIEFGAAAIRQHVAPSPECTLGTKLGAAGVQCCIDVSDGLSTDLWRMCRASGTGAVIEWERLPLFPELHTIGRSLGVVPEEAALHGGEEFALLFTSDKRESELSALLGRPVYAIGKITDTNEVVLMRNGASVVLVDGGFDHFDA